MPEPAVLIPLALAAIVVIRIVADRLDRKRIEADVAARGGVVLDISWKPFGRGWFGEKSDRVYLVEWTDASHVTHTSWCKTSLFTGVYWTEDGGRPPSRTGELEALRAENRRLREELEHARRGRGGA